MYALAYLPDAPVLGLGAAFLTAVAVTYLAVAGWPFWPRRSNYRGHLVPQAGAAVWWGAGVGLLTLWWRGFDRVEAGLMLAAVTVLFLAGLLDDCWPGIQGKGLRGHLRYWWQMGPDPALIKAASGVAVGLAQAAFRGLPCWQGILDTATVALAANTINLLDLRPGRALKGLLFLAGLLLVLTGGQALALLAPLVGAAVAFLRSDLRERAMLGDAGANALGAGLGMAAVLSLGPAPEAGLTGALFVLHLYAERESLSRLIERVPWLARLDGLGRYPAER
ncbi:MAG: hypothetical protein ACPLPT_02400 [Moorellales bacterium]